MSNSKQMLEALSSGDLEAAQGLFLQALEQDLPEEKLQLADNLLQLGFLEEANALFKDLLTHFPDEDSLKVSLAEIAIENNDIEEAFTRLETIKETSEFYPQSLLTQADIYQMLGIPEVSEHKLKEAKQRLTDEPLIDLALAELYFAEENYSQAVDTYQALMSAYPTFESPVDCQERMGVSLSRLGQFDEAITYLEESIKHEETVEKLFQLALTYYQVTENERSITLLEKILDVTDTFHQAYYPLAQILYDEGRHGEALDIAEQGIAANPYETALYHVASESAYQMGLKEEARHYLEEAISLEIESDFSKLKLAEFLLKEEDYDGTIELIQTLEQQEQGLAYWYLAQAYNGLESYEDAKTHYVLAQESLLDDPGFLKDMGLFLREEGDLEGAQALLERYMAFVPEDTEIFGLLDNE